MEKKQVVFDRPARLRVFREGQFWVAQLLLNTPTGVVGLQAAVSEKRVKKALERRAAKRAGGAETSGLFSTLKKAARSISRATAISKVVKAAKSLSPAQLVKLVPKPLTKLAEGAATKLVGAAMGGDEKAKKALRALRAVAKQADPTSKAFAAYQTVKRVAKRMVKGDLKGVAREVKSAALREAAPINAAVEAVEAQINRLPSPLNVSARAVLQTFPGVSAAYAVHAATEAWKRGQLFTPRGLVSAASALPGQPGAWANAARPYVSGDDVGALSRPRRSSNRYPMGYVALWHRPLKWSRYASGRDKTTTTLPSQNR